MKVKFCFISFLINTILQEYKQFLQTTATFSKLNIPNL